MVSTLELKSCRHAATLLINVVEEHVSSIDFKDDTFKRTATVYNMRFVMDGCSPAISLQVAMSDLSKIIHEGITPNASALREDSETHTCLSPGSAENRQWPPAGLPEGRRRQCATLDQHGISSCGPCKGCRELT